MEGLLRFSIPREVWILRDGKFLRLSCPTAVWTLPEASKSEEAELKRETSLGELAPCAGRRLPMP